jgi:23S rRNA (guanosine2251-2'-O)-methyltransferase
MARGSSPRGGSSGGSGSSRGPGQRGAGAARSSAGRPGASGAPGGFGARPAGRGPASGRPAGGAGRPVSGAGRGIGGPGGRDGGRDGGGRDGGRPASRGGSGGSGGGGRVERGPSRGGGRIAGRGAHNSTRSTGSFDPVFRPSERGLGGDLVEGRQAVRELLLANRRKVRDVWMVDGTDDAAILIEIEELATEARVPIRKVSREQLHKEARTETPQGVIAHAAPLMEVEFDDLLKTRNGRAPFLLAVDSVTDPQNLGALLRSADGAGVTGIILPKHRTVHVTPTVTKAAAGAIERMPMALVGGLPAAFLRAKEKVDAWILGLDADGPQSLYSVAALGNVPLIVVIGAEGAGLSRLVSARCDELISIPLAGSLASLNASVAGAIAMFELGRHRGAQ